MQVKTLLAFDDYVPSGVAQTFSSTELMETLGRCDGLCLHAIVDDVVVAGTFDLWIEHSANGHTYVQRSSAPGTAGNGDISMGAISIGGMYQKMWSDAAFSNASQPAGPLLPYLRLRLQLGGARAHVVVVATLRDGTV